MAQNNSVKTFLLSEAPALLPPQFMYKIPVTGANCVECNINGGGSMGGVEGQGWKNEEKADPERLMECE